MSNDHSYEEVGKLYDELMPREWTAEEPAWEALDVRTRRMIHLVYHRAWNDGFDLGEREPKRDNLGALPWRAGTKNAQTVYDANDRQVASAQTGEMARYIVEAVNATKFEFVALQNTVALLRAGIASAAESIENASNHPFASGDPGALKWAVEQLRKLIK